MKIIAPFIVLALISTGCAVSQESAVAGTYEEDFNALQAVRADDGISSSEAYVIAKAFFWSNISGCGFPDEPQEQNGSWVSKTYIGYAGQPGDPIYVNKATGDITWGEKTSSLSLNELKQFKSNNRIEQTR
jgi:hypothetical protein